MTTLGEGFFALKSNKLWKQFSGNYNSFFGVTKPYYITILSNPD